MKAALLLLAIVSLLLASCLPSDHAIVPTQGESESVKELAEDEDAPAPFRFGYGPRFNISTGGIDIGPNINGVGGFGGW